MKNVVVSDHAVIEKLEAANDSLARRNAPLAEEVRFLKAYNDTLSGRLDAGERRAGVPK